MPTRMRKGWSVDMIIKYPDEHTGTGTTLNDVSVYDIKQKRKVYHNFTIKYQSYKHIIVMTFKQNYADFIRKLCSLKNNFDWNVHYVHNYMYVLII